MGISGKNVRNVYSVMSINYSDSKEKFIFMGKIKLFVSTFGESTKWIKNGYPIEAGAANRSIDRVEGVYYDDSGDNISADNPYWGELTGLYWIWKNISFDEDDIVGFCHYNKKLSVSEKKIKNIFREKGKPYWIVRNPLNIQEHTYLEDVDALTKVLGEYDQSYLSAWNELYDSKGASLYGKDNCFTAQTFYTDAKTFDAYCRFLFDVLLQFRNERGEVDRTPYHKRYCAFMGERLTSVFIVHNCHNYSCFPFDFKENAFVKTMRYIKRIFNISPNSRLYKIAIKATRNSIKSSYVSKDGRL